MAEEFGQMSFGGLGYSASAHNSEVSETQHPSIDQASSSSVAGDMLKNLMRQCLAYHEEQQQKIPTNQDEHHVNPQKSNLPTPASENERPAVRNIHQDIEAGRSRASSILEKFQQLSQRHGDGGGGTTMMTISESANHGTNTNTIIAPSVYKAKRDIFFELENKRKREFLIKNFDWVAKRDRERYQQQIAQLDEAKQWENAVQDQYRQALEQRKKRLLGGNKKPNNNNNNNSLTSKAGIGSTKRKKVEKEKVKSGHHPSSHPAQHDSSVAVYLSGLPVDGSVNNLLNTLFSSYGTIRKIHLYRNKQSGELKGDGLIIYQIGKGSEKVRLLQSVCSQMNGAELPCGAILKVEPADASYQQQQQQQQGKPLSYTSHVGQHDARESVNPPSKESNPDKDDDSTGDLDDFFESLE